MEHRGHPAGAVVHAPALLNVARHRVGSVVQVILQVRIELFQLGRVQHGLAADVAHAQQLIDPAVLIALEVAAHCLRVEQQGIGHVRYRAPLAQQDDRVDAVRVAHIMCRTCLTMRRPQLGELLFAESAVDHDLGFYQP